MKLEEQYKKHLGLETKPNLNDEFWQAIETDLQRKEFYGFSFYHFNVYYAGIILLSLISTSFMMYKGYKFSNHEHRSYFEKKSVQKGAFNGIRSNTELIEKKESIEVNDSNKESSKTPLLEKEKESVIVSKNTNRINIQNRGNQENRLSKSADSVIKETRLGEPKFTTDLLDSVKTKNESEPVIIHHQDTIIKIDSVEVSRRKLRKLKQLK